MGTAGFTRYIPNQACARATLEVEWVVGGLERAQGINVVVGEAVGLEKNIR